MNLLHNLTELEKDALIEFFNIGIGSAIDSFSRFIGQEIIITIPQVEEAHLERMTREVTSLVTDISVVAQNFHGAFGSIDALVYFLYSDAIALLNHLLREPVIEDHLSELEKGGLIETGNIILNGCIETFAEILGSGIESTPPKLSIGRPQKIFAKKKLETSLGIAASLSFTIGESQIHGQILFLMNQETKTIIQRHLSKYIASLSGKEVKKS